MATEYEHDQRARKLVGAGALVLDEDGNALIVKPTYKGGWEIPGGVAEQGESPLTACIRELREELGLDIAVGRLLCVEYKSANVGYGDSLQWIFDGGTLAPRQIAALSLPADELSEYRFVPLGALSEFLSESLALRLRSAAQARERATTAYIEDGRVIAPNG